MMNRVLGVYNARACIESPPKCVYRPYLAYGVTLNRNAGLGVPLYI